MDTWITDLLLAATPVPDAVTRTEAALAEVRFEIADAEKRLAFAAGLGATVTPGDVWRLPVPAGTVREGGDFTARPRASWPVCGRTNRPSRPS
jgi:hypothetical protein